MWLRKKTFGEENPKTLSVERLAALQMLLMAKLILVNKELESRYRTLAELAPGLPDENKFVPLFTTAANELRGFNLILDQVLAKAAGKT